MNTQPQDPQRLRALELALQARREELPEEDRLFLDQYLSEHPEVAAEAKNAGALLAALAPVRLPVRSELRDRMRRDVASWVREDLLERPAVTTTREGAWRGLWSWLLGRGEAGPSWSTVMVGRSLAFYMGAAVAICLFLFLRDPGPAEDQNTVDRTVPIPEEVIPHKAGPEEESRDHRGRRGR